MKGAEPMDIQTICIRGERIQELYKNAGYSQKEYADRLGISVAQLRRNERDPEQAIRSDLLIFMAKDFKVSTDYLLGLSPVTRNNHDISHLHLSGAACEKLIRHQVDGAVLSRLIEQEDFGEFLTQAASYFDNTDTEAINIQNEMISAGAAMIRRHASEVAHPDRANAAAAGLELSIGDAEEIALNDLTEKARNLLQHTKEAVHVPTNRPASLLSTERIFEIIEEAHAQTHLTREEQIDYSADKIVDEISEKTGIKGTAIRILKPVFRFMFRNVGKDANKNQVD